MPEILLFVKDFELGSKLSSTCIDQDRQVEFSDENTQIMMCSPDGVQQRINLSELLPNSFGPEHL